MKIRAKLALIKFYKKIRYIKKLIRGDKRILLGSESSLRKIPFNLRSNVHIHALILRHDELFYRISQLKIKVSNNFDEGVKLLDQSYVVINCSFNNGVFMTHCDKDYLATNCLIRCGSILVSGKPNSQSIWDIICLLDGRPRKLFKKEFFSKTPPKCLENLNQILLINDANEASWREAITKAARILCRIERKNALKSL